MNMKATGIVRRIDDLGRVVIPKEIRRTMRIREGDPLEIYTGPDGEVVFKKYSAINELENAAEACEVISKLGGAPAVVFDRDHVVAVAGAHKKEYSERRISHDLEELLDNRSSFCMTEPEGGSLRPIEGMPNRALAVAPIISRGDVAGAVAFVENESNRKADERQIMLTKAAAMFLGKQIES
ncbi:MAG: AbrB/MazE/SpoVT family DNA-binding domain-containing protein [Ruminococcus sp.]|nr:AbrB/MazE/SpoVT family DNA-binding domain-containing protein [Ruminococcus sp.]